MQPLLDEQRGNNLSSHDCHQDGKAMNGKVKPGKARLMHQTLGKAVHGAPSEVSSLTQSSSSVGLM